MRMALGHPEQAAGFAGRAMARDPDNFDALVARRDVPLAQGPAEGRLRDLERAVAIDPISVEALRLLAQVGVSPGSDRPRPEAVARANRSRTVSTSSIGWQARSPGGPTTLSPAGAWVRWPPGRI